MSLFNTNGRIQKSAEGIRFYEQDVLCSDYGFSGNTRIEVVLDYVAPGFGIALMDNTKEDTPTNAHSAYLFKLGSNDFRVFYKHFKTQDLLHTDSCTLGPSRNNKNITLVFSIEKKNITVSQKLDSETGPITKELAAYTVETAFKEYKIGFYSNAGNTIRSISFYDKIPSHWRVSTKNSMGGRISFDASSAKIENCEKEAEIEQFSIPLEAGKYYVRYETAPVNGTDDIRCFIFKTYADTLQEAKLEDDKKNILAKDGSFILKEAAEVNLKFKGHNGVIKNIFITDDDSSSFIETEDEQYIQDGSKIIVKLKNVESVKWRALIKTVPQWDFSTECPYIIAGDSSCRPCIEELNIKTGTEYTYTFMTGSKKLSISSEEKQIHERTLPLKEDLLTIMYNVNSVIDVIEITEKNGNVINILTHKTFKHYVPAEIESPIIVTNENDDPLDISASYREIAVTQKRIQLFSKSMPVQLDKPVPINTGSIQVYGIPKGASIDAGADTIEKFASSFTEIPESRFSRKKNIVRINEEVWNSFDRIAVVYNVIGDFYYEFTNMEREIFDGAKEYIVLEKQPAVRNQNMVIYGIRKDVEVHDEYIFRVPSPAMMNSIDYYADEYEIIPPNLWTNDAGSAEILFNPALKDRYKTYVVDYMKKDSYSINYRNQYQQYEVDISTEENQTVIHYDSRDNGSIAEYKQTGILPDKSKYIVLKQGGRR